MLTALALPPGVFRNGTMYQASGRYYDANLTRWYEGTLRPWGGWAAFSASAVTGAARAIEVWQDASGNIWEMVGTHSNLYVYDAAGNQTDVTPSGLVVGRADATLAAGYGGGNYGAGTYGTPRVGSAILAPATVWALDTLEQNPVACNADDGLIYSWDLNTSHIAAQCTNSPSSCRSVVVTQEGFIMALGAAADPRNIQWADQESFTAWTPTASNMARSYSLQTPGSIMCGMRTKAGTLIFTTTEVHLAQFIGLPGVYSFNQVGTDCGALSQGAIATSGDIVAWMSPSGFWTYNGAVAPLLSDVGDYVYGRMNNLQRSKVTAVHNAVFGEFTWFYPSVGIENDSYVTFNYREVHWSIGSLVRLCGAQAGVLTNPLMVDASGNVWTHETGFTYTGAATPYAETGPIEYYATIYGGDETQGAHVGTNVFDIVAMQPDALTFGDATLMFYSRFGPNDADTTWGPYPLADPMSLRISGRQARMRVTAAASGDWRWGLPRLDFRGGGER